MSASVFSANPRKKKGRDLNRSGSLSARQLLHTVLCALCRRMRAMLCQIICALGIDQSRRHRLAGRCPPEKAEPEGKLPQS